VFTVATCLWKSTCGDNFCTPTKVYLAQHGSHVSYGSHASYGSH